MSEQTKAALEAAIEEHVADEIPGAVVGAYVLVAETTRLADLDADMSSRFAVGRGSGFTRRGLIESWRDVDQQTWEEEDE